MHQWKTQTVAISSPNGLRPELQRRGARWELRPWPAAHRAADRYSKHDWASHGQKPGKTKHDDYHHHLAGAAPPLRKGLAPPSTGAGDHRGPGGPSPLTSVGKLFKLDSLSLETKSSDVD